MRSHYFARAAAALLLWPMTASAAQNSNAEDDGSKISCTDVGFANAHWIMVTPENKKGGKQPNIIADAVVKNGIVHVEIDLSPYANESKRNRKKLESDIKGLIQGAADKSLTGCNENYHSSLPKIPLGLEPRFNYEKPEVPSFK